MFNIQEELKKLPAKPGVYIMHNNLDEVIYVGKAVILKNRVRQYFQNPERHTAKIRKMVSSIDHFEYIVTDSEVEALVLECNLIKEYRPKYNTMLKDDKSYPYIRVTVNEAFPRVMMTRQMKRDGSRYFGPYPNYIRDMLDLIHKVYGIRNCTRNLPQDIGKERPCLNYQIGRCPAPCQGYITEEEYRKRIDEVIRFLDGDTDAITTEIERRMQAAAERLEFEEAASYRDLLATARKMNEQQKINSTESLEDRDYIAMARADDEAVIQVFFVRGGKLIGREHFEINDVRGEEKAQIYAEFIKQYYAGTPFVPREVMVQGEVADAEVIASYLTLRRGGKVNVTWPKRGEKAKLIELAYQNASMVLNKDSERNKREMARTLGALRDLGKLLGIGEIHRVESYDISNTSGYENVGSMVVFVDGKPKNRDYRKFRIKGFKGQNDYASMEEVLTRRFTHGLEEQEKLKESGLANSMGKFSEFPDLILMDGGRGQVNICLAVLEKLGISLPVAGLVKDDHHRTRGIYYNNVLQPIDTSGEMFHLITRIQDETHRFAISYHKLLRSKDQVKSILDDIPGVGEKRRRALMRHFVSLDAIKNASEEELADVETMNRASAKAVYDFFRTGGQTEGGKDKTEDAED